MIGLIRQSTTQDRLGRTNLSRYRTVLFVALSLAGFGALSLTSVVCHAAAEHAEHKVEASQALQPRRVLLISEGEMETPADRAVDAGIRSVLSVSAVAAGSSVKFAVLTQWSLYKRWIVGGATIALLQTAFLTFLLAQRRRQRKAELLLGLELRFESFTANLSATFANVSAAQTNAEIANTLEKLREFLDLERLSLYEVSQEEGQFVLSRVASLEGGPPGPQSFDREELPWIVSHLLRGGDWIIRCPEDLPIDADGEQVFLGLRNYKFAGFVPLRVASHTLGCLAFISSREGARPDGVVQRLRVVAEIFANALVRKQFERGLGESQQRFQLLANSAPIMIWMSEQNKLRSFFNKQWLEFTGRALDQELGNGWLEGVHPEDFRQCLNTYSSSFEARLPFTMEFRLKRANGEYGWVFDSGVPRYTPAGEFMGYIGSCMDITGRMQAEQGILDLSGRLIFAQEEERCRIARELHDDFSQRLAVLAIQLGQVSQSLPHADRATVERLHQMWEKTTELSADIHRLSHQLHSSKLHHVGLLAAAKSLCEETEEQHGIRIEFIDRRVPEEIPPDMGLCFFRIVQEALSNIVRHSGAKQAHVEFVGTPSHLRLRIVDAGVGFDPSSRASRGGLGLASMRERLRLVGGNLSLCSQPMEGTEIVAEVPLTPTDLGRQFVQTARQHAVGG
jgi:PAS domain S-box-containing protein